MRAQSDQDDSWMLETAILDGAAVLDPEAETPDASVSYRILRGIVNGVILGWLGLSLLYCAVVF